MQARRQYHACLTVCVASFVPVVSRGGSSTASSMAVLNVNHGIFAANVATFTFLAILFIGGMIQLGGKQPKHDRDGNMARYHDVRVPSQAGKPEVSDVTKDSMKISWTIPNTDGGSQILRCIAGRKEHTAVRWLCINKSLKECRFVDETVDKDIEDNYMYRITAKNKSGPSSRSLPTVSQDNLGTIQLNNTKSSYERNRNMAKHVLGLLGMTALVLLAFIWAQDHHKQNNVAGMMTSCILPNGGVLYVQYDPKTKVKHLKKEAVKKYEENILSSKHAQYRLVHDGWNLPDNAMLGDCSVFGNSTVNLKCLMEGGQPKTPICLKNTCLSTSGQYSCAIDSFLELFFFSIYKQLPDFSQLTNNLGPLLSKVLSTCTARDKSITPNDIQEARETTWEWAIQNVATFAGRTMRACIDELFPHITRTDWEKKYFSLTKTFSRHCLRCNYGKEDIREYCPLVPSANLFDVDKSMKSAINTIIGRGEGVGHCSSCGGQSVKCELKDIQLPEYLFVEVPYVPQHGRWDNLCGVRIEQDMTIREQPYKVVGGIRAKPGHFTAIVSRGGLLYEVDDMCPAPVKEGHTLANIFDQGGDVLTTAPGNLLHMIVYKRAANIVSDMITEVSDNDEAANIVSDMITEVSDNDEAANIVSDMITEVSDNDEAANIVSDMITEVSDNHEAANIVSDMDTEVSDNDETRVSLSSVENSATSVWRPWATFSRKLAQTTSQIMPMRRESSTTTRDKENGHLLTQRGKSGALRKEDTPRVHSVVGRTIDWMWRNLRYLIGQHKHSEIPAAVEASHNFESKGRSAITQLRRKMKASKKPKVMKTKRKRTKRLSIWARFVSKESQKLKGHMKRGNCIQNAREISKRWKTLTAEQRRDFTEESRKSFQKRQLEKSINSPKVVHPNRSPAYKTAIAGLSPLMKDCLQKKQLKEKTALAHPQ
ncbi:IGSF22 [Branchiostoma lanceolatum]|uniref:IGSF22 protein n=2 Tax=Branchiostoma lanceolatum TaxID=7740 RepID=A0A8K0AIJ7_BRALA|nr:IGSF22 [Branchiostoma lanceolatum]